MHYGPHPDQWLEYYEPEHITARGAVMIIHGGYWREKYTAELGVPLAQDLASRGIPAYNLEYRRGPGSIQQMVYDANLAVGLIAQEGPITIIGHSAGGHLGCLVAARNPRITQVVSQAGLLDLQLAHELKLSNQAVEEVLGDKRLATYDPVQLWPMAARVIIFHGVDDDDVPLKIARSAAAKAAALGQNHEFTLFEGDHYTWIDPNSSQWEACVQALSPVHF